MTVPTTTLRGARDAELGTDAATAGTAPSAVKNDLRLIVPYVGRKHRAYLPVRVRASAGWGGGRRTRRRSIRSHWTDGRAGPAATERNNLTATGPFRRS